MKRDGACTSLWQDGMSDYEPAQQDINKRNFDVLIVGGGITGITTALLLQRAGKSVLVAEAKSLCFGTTGGTTSHLNTILEADYSRIEKNFGEEDAQLMAKATRESLDLFRKHVEEFQIDCGYEEKDAFLFSQTEDQSDELEKIYKASEKAGVELSWAEKIPVNISFQMAIAFARNAQLHPSRYVYALAAAFEKEGGVILQDCRILDVKEDELLEVESSRGMLQAKNIIYATHTPPGINLLHFRLAPYRSYAMAVKLADENYPDGLVYDMYDPYHYYRTQVIDGNSYLIVGGEDHKTAHEENTENCFNRLETHTRKYFNVDEISFRWSSQFFESTDGLAYIGRLPGHPDNVYVATGYSGNGITYSHIAAVTLTELITTGKSRYEELLDPSRIKMVAGFGNFVKENADVIAQFVGKRISVRKLNELADLAPGDARLVRYEGKTIALYRADTGSFHAINPVCPHAKCMVGWNMAEKSWDCPCHGSRFSVTGELLTGPSRADLEIIELDELVEENTR